MASFLILRRASDADEANPASYVPTAIVTDKKADEGEAAILEGFTGEGAYAAVRWDNATFQTLVSGPQVIE